MKKEEIYKEILSNWKVPGREDTNASWEELQNRISVSQPEETKVVKMPWLVRRGWAVAAAAAVVVAVFMFSKGGDEITVLAENSVKTVELPDGSKVTLNENSSITYNQSWEERVLTLEGEAFFDVKRGERFVVETEKGNISVLGTSFNIYAEDEMLMVDCYTGKVQVTAVNQFADDTEILTTGLCTSLKNGHLISAREHGKEEILWNGGNEFMYEGTPAKKVLNDLERRFDVEIIAPEINKGVTWNGSADNVEDVLAIVCKPNGLNFTIENSVVKITQM
ncbi:MAG: FecR family protein [Flavobacteriales bacterium]|nr:FecR family protein [Flavobacteriales bacterium]